jgi:hypothetical protein
MHLARVLRNKHGAGKGVRTPDIYLGKVVLYQLSYTRMLSGGATETRTQKAAFTTRRISNPLQYHYGTAPVNYLVGTLAYYKKIGSVHWDRTSLISD